MQTKEQYEIDEAKKEKAGEICEVSQRSKRRLSAKLNSKETFSQRLKRQFKEKSA